MLRPRRQSPKARFWRNEALEALSAIALVIAVGVLAVHVLSH